MQARICIQSFAGLTCLMPDKFNLIHFHRNCPDHSPAMHHDTALLPCDWSTRGMQPFDWMTERSTTIKYQWYQENSHKPNFSHKKVVMMHICEQNSDQISQGQKTIINESLRSLRPNISGIFVRSSLKFGHLSIIIFWK